MQAKNRGNLQHAGLEKLLGHLESSTPPCMSAAPDWESSHGWLDAADSRPDGLQLPPLHDPGVHATQDRHVQKGCALSPAGIAACPANTLATFCSAPAHASCSALGRRECICWWQASCRHCVQAQAPA